ncbi:Polyprotein [Phytophthora palmivora]|uniref:Polyprotein n=1 Tax=Phytophthora palmivora TaxID=4796 RepID=A0A2P4YHY1_9STRA|nr:Polyprotein [Phytophthora palmivora]
MGFKTADADPCVYTRDEGVSECIECKGIIASVMAGIAEKFRIMDLGCARFILGIQIDYDMERRR